MSMPGKQARVLCPVCAEPMPPDETECANCGAFVIDEAVVRLSRAFGLDREKALKLFEAGFRPTKQLQGPAPNPAPPTGGVGPPLLFPESGRPLAPRGPQRPPRAPGIRAAPPATPPGGEDILV